MAITLERYFPYDAGPGGSAIAEEQWRQMTKFWSADGVMRDELNEFEVFADSTGMQVKVKSGRCLIRGNYGDNLNQVTHSIATADPTLIRYDLVILRNDFVGNRIEIDVLEGTPGAGVPDTVTQNSAIWEVQLGVVTIDPTVITITAAKCVALQTFASGLAGQHLIKRGRRTTQSSGSTSTTADGVLRVSGIKVVKDRAYRVVASFNPISTVATDVARVEMRYATTGVDAVTSDAVLPGHIGTYLAATPGDRSTIYVPAANQNLSLLLCVARESGSGTVRLFADGTKLTAFAVYEAGADTGNDGVAI